MFYFFEFIFLHLGKIDNIWINIPIMESCPCITVISGPMFAGKTSKLIEYLNSQKESKYVLKPKRDNRYSDYMIVSHNDDRHEALAIDNLCDVLDEIKTLGVYNIYIDEGQFFNDMQEFINGLDSTYRLVIAGLDNDYLKKPFESMTVAATNASIQIFLTAECECGKDAIYTARKIPSTERFVIGGSESYIPCCSDCWQKYNKK